MLDYAHSQIEICFLARGVAAHAAAQLLTLPGVGVRCGNDARLAPVDSKMDRLVEELVERRIRLRQALQEFERKFISLVLEEQRGNCSKAARQLGIHRNTLLSKMQKAR